MPTVWNFVLYTTLNSKIKLFKVHYHYHIVTNTAVYAYEETYADFCEGKWLSLNWLNCRRLLTYVTVTIIQLYSYIVTAATVIQKFEQLIMECPASFTWRFCCAWRQRKQKPEASKVDTMVVNLVFLINPFLEIWRVDWPEVEKTGEVVSSLPWVRN